MKNKYNDLIEQTFEFPQEEFKTEENELLFHDIPLMDMNKRKALKEKTGFDVDAALRHIEEEKEDEESKTKEYSVLMSAIMIIGGLAGLIIGGKLFVNGATQLAKMFGVSDKFIAITVMAAGTSMPELATCVVAALKGRGQLALGNVLGSNISNILLILGGAALINPLSCSGMTMVDLGLILVSAIFIFASAFMFKRRELDRYEGVILILMEIGYMWYLIANL